MHADAIDREVAARTLPESWRQRLLVITPAGRECPLPTDHVREPYLLPELRSALRSIEKRLGSVAPEPEFEFFAAAAPRRLDECEDRDAGTASPPTLADKSHCEGKDADELATTLAPILGSIGRALAPFASAAEGWLQLIAQDIPRNDPAQPPIGHARRELRGLDRTLRLLRLADDPTPPFRGGFSLSSLLHEVVEEIGVTPVPVAVEIADDLPDVLADPKLTRHACDGLLRGILEAGGRPDGVVIRARDVAYGVELVIIEDGHRLDVDQLRELCAPGRSLLYNSPGRGLGFPLARILFGRQGVTMSVEDGESGQLEIRVRFASANAGRGIEGQPNRGSRHGNFEEGAR